MRRHSKQLLPQPLPQVLPLVLCVFALGSWCAPERGYAGDDSSRLSLLPADPIREKYVKEALAGNLALRQRHLSVEEAATVLAQARAQFFPSVNLEARASERYGNVLDFGPLVNPAYRQLNDLAGQQLFPTDIHLALPFKRETKVVVTQPLLAPGLVAQYALRRDQATSEQVGWEVLARQVRADVQTAYFQHGRAVRLEALLGETRKLLEEVLRVSTLLVKEGKVTEDAVFRARAELSGLDVQRDQATDAVAASRHYLNFLCNAPLDQPVPTPGTVAVPEALPVGEDAAVSRGDNRHELTAVAAGQRAASAAAALARSAYLPTLGAVAEYGFQGDRYDFSPDKDYLILSLVLRWNLWNGLGDRARVRQAELQQAKLSLAQQELRQQIAMQVRQAWRAADSARRAIAQVHDRMVSSESAYEIVSRKYAAGGAPAVDLLEARTTRTRAEVDQIFANYDFAIRLVELERVAALDDGSTPMP